ncbi:MAG TPA: MBL fold metallo-hydrolase [Anaerolineales bacterium]|nr:MBL fold metallo-hydrolase [Anaerolineales bacterium]
MTSDATYATFETFGGAKIHRLPLQAFPNFWAYAYVVQKDKNIYLIDTGSGTDTSNEDLLNGLQQARLHPSDLTHILLTHAHIDHYGGLTNLRPLTDAKIGCHELDIQTIAYHDARLALIGRRLASFLAETGLAKEEIESLLGIYRFTKALYKSVPVDFTYKSQNMKSGPFEMIHLPGHCPGHIAMRLGDVVFCGDMVVNGVTPHLAPESINPYGGLDHYLESLSRFQNWAQGARLILNGHNDVITDLHASIETTRKNIIRRICKAIGALHDPLTIAETSDAVYGDMGGYNQLLVIEKTGAYIEYLYEHGMVEVKNFEEVEQGQPARYKRTREYSETEILPKEKEYVLI